MIQHHKPSGAERRRAKRQKVSAPALLRLDGENQHLICRIVDLSTTGARVELRPAVGSLVAVAATGRLLLEREQAEIACTVVRRQGLQLGVKFTGPLQHLPRSQPRRGLVVSASRLDFLQRSMGLPVFGV